MIIESGDWSVPYIFLKFLKKLNGNRWTFPPGISSIDIPYGVVQVELVDGGDRHDFQQMDWRREQGQHILRMRISNQIPRQE